MPLDRGVSQVAGRHHMRDLDPQPVLGCSSLGEVNLKEAAMAPVDLDKWIDRFDHAGAGRPSAADAGGERDDRRLAAVQGGFSRGE